MASSVISKAEAGFLRIFKRLLVGVGADHGGACGNGQAVNRWRTAWPGCEVCGAVRAKFEWTLCAHPGTPLTSSPWIWPLCAHSIGVRGHCLTIKPSPAGGGRIVVARKATAVCPGLLCEENHPGRAIERLVALAFSCPNDHRLIASATHAVSRQKYAVCGPRSAYEIIFMRLTTLKLGRNSFPSKLPRRAPGNRAGGVRPYWPECQTGPLETT